MPKGYLFLDRLHPENKDVALVYDSPGDALRALEDDNDPLINTLTAEDCIDLYMVDNPGQGELVQREVIVADEVEWTFIGGDDAAHD